MDTVFPFGFPWPTAMYLALFVLTSALSTALAQYALAASVVLLAWNVIAMMRSGAAAGPARAACFASGLGLIQKVACDWLPAVLGLAIAASIAPFLLLQILYRREFYAASQLLYIRMLLVVLALATAFLLLYLLKSEAFIARSAWLRVLLALAACTCLLFIAWAWTGNHVLGLHEKAWQSQHASRRWIYGDAEVWPRLGYWITASFPTLAVALAWQLHWQRRLLQPADLDRASHPLKTLALLGLLTSVVEAWLWQLWLERSARAVVMSAVAMPYVAMASAGMGIQAAGWVRIRTGAQLVTRRLALISSGAVLTILGSVAVREARRLSAIDVTKLFEMHRQAAHAPGMGLFFGCFAGSAAVIAACVLVVRRALRPLQ
jgi:hypothetical protein